MKIAVIGSGIAGLGAAWLLDGRHEIVVFEKRDYLGGHAHTIEVKQGSHVVPVDTAVQFLSRQMYPVFLRLLALLDVDVVASPLTTTFHSRPWNRSIRLNPSSSLRDLFGALRPTALSSLLQFAGAVHAARAIDERGDWDTSVESFADGLPLTSRFKHGFLYPLLSSIWGTSADTTRRLSARAVMKYPLYHWPDKLLSPFELLQVRGGVGRYVNRLSSLLTTTDVRLESEIQAVRREAGRFVLTESGGATHAFDGLIVAAPGQAAARLLATLPEAARLRDVLDRFRTFKASIAIHSDAGIMPQPRSSWGTVNVIHDGHDGNNSALTVWLGAERGMDLFKSWVTFRPEPPERVVGIYDYNHVLMMPDNFRAQRELAGMQGQNDLWCIGSYTEDIDSHESGLLSAIAVARRIDENAPNLKRLLAGA